MTVPIDYCACAHNPSPWWAAPLACGLFVAFNLFVYWVLKRTYPRR